MLEEKEREGHDLKIRLKESESKYESLKEKNKQLMKNFKKDFDALFKIIYEQQKALTQTNLKFLILEINEHLIQQNKISHKYKVNQQCLNLFQNDIEIKREANQFLTNILKKNLKESCISLGEIFNELKKILNSKMIPQNITENFSSIQNQESRDINQLIRSENSILKENSRLCHLINGVQGSESLLALRIIVLENENTILNSKIHDKDEQIQELNQKVECIEFLNKRNVK